MRIGVISDTHDRYEAIAEAVRRLQEQRVELILHCGDIESVEAVEAFRGTPTYFVFGNWDRRRKELAAAIKAIGGVYYETFGVLEICNKRIAWLHSHERRHLKQLEHADYFDYLFYGHTHLREQHRTGRTLVANPGALFRANPKTCIVVDVITGEIKPLIIAGPARGNAEVLEEWSPVVAGDSTTSLPSLVPSERPSASSPSSVSTPALSPPTADPA
ncbi:MAG: YfcE family phosphodiesterase [Gemmataceae bacterium]|nr:YfcE family phosphodiesterase [Gemmataceae bacterium]